VSLVITINVITSMVVTPASLSIITISIFISTTITAFTDHLLAPGSTLDA
jgi:hypothetical protein